MGALSKVLDPTILVELEKVNQLSYDASIEKYLLR
jgi:hypothetical protein